MKILTVISNFNEEKAIRDTIEDFRKNSSIESDLLVIDNCSTDGSIDLIKEMEVDFLAHPVNTGGSSGVIKTAFAYAYYHDYDIYCHMDGDNQHSGAELANLVATLLNNDAADIVVGSRFITKRGFQSLFMRRLGIYLFSKIVSIITKNNITDITSGFRAYNKRAISYFATRFKHEIETPSQLELVMFYAGLRRMEVPVIMKPRHTGKSEFNFKNSLKFPLYNMMSIIGTLINRNR